MITNLLYNPDYLEHTKYKCLKNIRYYHFTDVNILAYDARAMKDGPDLKFVNTDYMRFNGRIIFEVNC